MNFFGSITYSRNESEVLLGVADEYIKNFAILQKILQLLVRMLQNTYVFIVFILLSQ